MANVLAHDRIDGVRATVSTVVLSQVSSTESHVVLDAADGSVDVTTGAALGTHTLVYTICNTGAVNVTTKTNSGIYALTYRICEAASPTNCDTAVATVGAWPVYSRARRDAVGLGVAPASPRCPMISLTSVTRDSLEAFTIAVFRALGLTDEDAAIFGRALVFSELRFHPGHGQGVKRLRRYQQRITERQVDPTARWEIVKESPALALVDAHNGIGTVAAAKAMRLAIEKAKVCGIGQVVVRNSTHFGSSAVHACQASDAGCLGIAFTNAGPEMAPWGAREGAVGTNPWGIAAPTGLGFPAVLDIALTTAGKGMMQWHAREGRPMPLDWALTPDGRETDDPNTAMTGALLGIGTYKGYGLAFMTDVLTGVIGGGGYGLTPYADPAKLDVSHTLTAIDIAWFMPLAEFTRRMDDFARMVKSRARRPGVAEVLIPGEQEARRVAKKAAGGVPLDDEVLADLQALGRELGLTETLAIVGPWREPTL